MNVFEFLQEAVEFEHDEINKLLDKLTPEHLEMRMSEDHTVRGRLIHMSKAEFGMANYLYEIKDSKLEVNDDASIEEIRSAFQTSKLRHKETLQNLGDDDLDKIWTSKASGNSYSYKLLLWHFLEHLATHRGQIAMFIRQVDEK